MAPAIDTGKAGSTGERYRFDGIAVDAAAHTLTREGEPVAVEPKAFAVLLELLRRPGELVGREQLMDAVWGHRFVTPGVLTRAIAQLRSALDDDSHNSRYIQTRHALGYSFVGKLDEETLPEPGMEEPPAQASEEAPAEVPLPESRPPSIDAASPALHWPWLLGLLAVALALWGWQQRSGNGPSASGASIAVLPFKSLSSHRDDDYFAEGLAVEMHDALAGVQGLQVAARMSSGMGLGEAPDVRTLGERLGVATVLDATVRREGQRIRISARLSDTSTGYTLWSQSYDRELSDVFETQTEIAQHVVQALTSILPEEREAIARRLAPTADIAAFDSYLKGLWWLFRPNGGDGGEQAISYFNQALRHDSRFARAQAGICRVQIWRFDLYRDASIFDLAQQACQRAEQMDPTLPEVTLALGDLYRINGDFDTALSHYREVEHQSAQQVEALIGIGRLHAAQGDAGGAIDHLRKAVDASPGNARLHAEMGVQQYLAGQIHEAIASYRDAIRLEPDSAENWGTYGGLLMVDGQNDEAAKALKKSIRIAPNDSVLSNLGTLNYQAGRYEEAGLLYRQAIELNPGDFMLWGFLGDALLADVDTMELSSKPFEEAAIRAGKYLDIRGNDAQALAALGWYQANLGEQAKAGNLARLAREHAGQGTDSVEVALYNAQTLAALGDMAGARRELDTARQAGVAEIRISTNVFLRRAGVIDER